jgi:hypothetical protein
VSWRSRELGINGPGIDVRDYDEVLEFGIFPFGILRGSFGIPLRRDKSWNFILWDFITQLRITVQALPYLSLHHKRLRKRFSFGFIF